MSSMKAKTLPVTATESSNFYFLVKVCGVSPLDIPHMTPFQVKTLIYQHNKIEKEKQEALEKQKKDSPKKTKSNRK